MLQSRHIVVADYADGKTETLYQGPDYQEAEKAKEKAVQEAKAEAVMVFHHPSFSQIRYPFQEAQVAEERRQQTARAEKAAQERMLKDAQAKRETAKKLVAEAKKLETEAQERLGPELNDPKA